jgi:hypothetical protein
MGLPRTTTGRRVEIQKFPLIGEDGILIYEEIGADNLWTPCRLRDGFRNLGKLKPYDGPRPDEKRGY